MRRLSLKSTDFGVDPTDLARLQANLEIKKATSV